MAFEEHLSHDTQHLLIDAASRALPLPQLLRSSGLRLYYGDLHNHTSNSDGVGHPAEALRQMRERGLHFAAITDHGEFFDRETAAHNARNWALLAEQTAALTSDDFVAIRGFEWSSPRQGHSNVWWSDEYSGYLRTGDESMAAYYEWLAAARSAAGGPGVLAGFNHPGRETACFDGCLYVPGLDQRIVTLECFNRDDEYGEAYFRALDSGWHVGAIGVSDHHGDDWGSARWPRAGLLAPALTPAAIWQALAARRVFATRSPTLMLLLAGNGRMMGSRLSLNGREALTLNVWCDDPAASRALTRLELWSNGGTLIAATETRGLHNLTWAQEIAPQGAPERWFTVRVLHGGITLAYSSPIWAAWI
jgi:hypothetical protein